MKKVYLMKGIAVMALGLTIASCSKDVFDPNALQAQNEEAFNNNFQKSVLNGQEIDPDQTWSTAAPSTITATVNLNYGETYTLYITESNPLIDANAAFLGSAVIKSGSSETFTITRPSDTGGYFAALYDKNNHAIVKPFAIENGETTITFGEESTRSFRAASSGNRWSVTGMSMPSLTAYTTGTTAINDENNTTNPANTVTKYEIPAGTTWSKNIPLLQSGSGISVYVKGTLRIDDYNRDGNWAKEQRVNGNCAIVVANGGVLEIPEGAAVNTNANNSAGTVGMVYVEPGGIIRGAGSLNFNNGTANYSYNGGTITVANINLNGGVLYNAGTLGDPNGIKPAVVGPSTGSKLINMGKATLASMGGAGMAVENACNLVVVGQMELGNTSKMDNGSYTECGSLKLSGSNNGDILMYMGQAAYLKNKGDFSVNNFGVWGPTSGSNAIFELSNSVSYANMTANAPGTQMLDRVELIIPSDFPAEITNGGYGTNAAGYVIYGWFNGLNFTTINPDAFVWEQNYEKYGDWNSHNTNVANKNSWTYTNNANVTDDRRTCILGNSPSYTVVADEDGCGTGFTPSNNVVPSSNFVYYAFEDLGTTDDFDFNDVVLRVSARNAEGKCSVDLMAAGGTMSTIVTYNGRQIGTEVHSAFETDSEKIMVNTDASDGVSKDFVNLSTIQVDADADLTNLPLGITCQSGSSVINVTRTAVSQNSDRAPLVIVVSGNSAGKWFWPKERVNISTAYTQFGAWGADVSSYPKWYLNYANGQVHTWQ